MSQDHARDLFGRRIFLSSEQMEAAQRAGLTAEEARRQFRLRTLGEGFVYVLCWAALVAVSLPADRQALKCTPSGGQAGIAAMIVVMGILPLAGFASLIGHRVWLWRRLLKISESRTPEGYSVSLYTAPWRTFIAIHTLGRTYYVPLMRGQRVESLEPIGLLRPLVTPEPRAQVPFRVAETGRVVWPGGGCHPSVWPVGRVGFTVVRVFGPLLLVPVMHWVTSTLPC